METKKNMTSVFKSVFVITAALMIIIYPVDSASSAVRSIDICLETIIPSMFAFMVLTTYIQTTGLYNVLFRPVLWIMRKIIKADDRIISVFLLSLFGGYPIGVKLLRDITTQNKNSPAIASSCPAASMFCYCISPSFAVIMIGNGIFGSPVTGLIIYLSDILACILTAVVVSRLYDLKTRDDVSIPGGTILDSVNSASRSLFPVCTVIVAFNIFLSGISAFLNDLGVTLAPMISGIFEISNLLNIKEPDISMIPFIAVISSFGGICVLFQCAALIHAAFPLRKFLLARIPCSVLSGIISFIVMQFADISVSASTVTEKYVFSFSGNKILVVILTAMCIIILYKSNKLFRKV
ncbi:MAG: hypothetical protein J6X60_08185 [Ruminiclostridium sp.]|nr:hypothetical protein [Ruminiclostridium sp.]